MEALTRASHIDEGRYVFEKMLTHANHVGLFAEEIGPTGEALGNFPAGLHPPRPDQRCMQPRPGAVGRLAATMSELDPAAVNDMDLGLLTGAVVAIVGCLLVLAWLPARSGQGQNPKDETDTISLARCGR